MADNKIDINDYSNYRYNDREKSFCKQYITNGWRPGEAAISAGYSKKTASQIASRLLTNVKIQAYIKHLRQNIEETTGISKERIVQALVNMAFSSLGDYRENWMKQVEYDSLTKEQKACISEIETDYKQVKLKEPDEFDKKGNRTKVGRSKTTNIPIIKFKLYSRLDAIKEINKIMAYYSAEKHQFEGDMNIVWKEEKTYKNTDEK